MEDGRLLVLHLPCKHGSWEAINAQIRLVGLCDFVDQSQFALGAVVQADLPIEVFAHNNLGWRGVHGLLHPVDDPVVDEVLRGVLCRTHLGKSVTTPFPGFRFPEQVAGRVHLSVTEAVLHQDVRILSGFYSVNGILKHLGSKLVGHLQQIVPVTLGHGQKVLARKLARRILNFGILLQDVVLQHVHTVFLIQSVHDQRLHVFGINCLHLNGFRQTQQVQRIQRGQLIPGQITKIQKAHQAVNHLVLVIQLHAVVPWVFLERGGKERRVGCQHRLVCWDISTVRLDEYIGQHVGFE
mmetsp:Transcript_64946/g.79495  ORF Transcript_64946/g.79495 Transcript_64946/m.79495 type:complete len:296 (+) Transcript_64946:87-974(+)